MKITSIPSIGKRTKADVLIVPFVQKAKSAECVAEVNAAIKANFTPAIKNRDFTGKEGETNISYSSKLPEARILLVGLGSEKNITLETLRKAYAKATGIARKMQLSSVNAFLPELSHLDCDETARAIADSMLLSNYAFAQYKTREAKEMHLLQKGGLLGTFNKKVLSESEAVVKGVFLARNLVNENSHVITTDYFCNLARDFAKKNAAVKTTILRGVELEKKGLGLLSAVGRAGEYPPALIIIEYQGNPSSKEVTAFVGKGMTYDTGGLNMKPTGGIEGMRSDMGGAAAVFGTLEAAIAMKLKKNLLAVVATAENSVDSTSYKPGDIYTSYSGLTVEIGNTDAEGRLILADALSYVEKNYKPSRIIDLATLTGAIVIALGSHAIGLFSPDDQLAQDLEKAGAKTFERVWRFPMFPEYKEGLKAQFADIVNVGGREGASILAAMFLKEFVKKTPWAHLDIAGTAVTKKPHDYCPTWGTGVGVRLLIEFLQGGK